MIVVSEIPWSMIAKIGYPILVINPIVDPILVINPIVDPILAINLISNPILAKIPAWSLCFLPNFGDKPDR